MNWSDIINQKDFVWTTNTQQTITDLSSDVVEAAFALHSSIFSSDDKSYTEFLSYVEQLIFPCSSIAEFGCGNGANLYYFSKQYQMPVAGCDISSDLINLAKLVIPGSVFTVGDKFEIDDCAVDYCISNSVFQYFPSDEYAQSVIDEMLRISKKGILITDIKSKETEADFKATQAKRQGLTIADLELKYKNTPLKCYPKTFFEKYNAKFLNMPANYPDSHLKSYSVMINKLVDDK
jgi:SAM-dependent methyltransferase